MAEGFLRIAVENMANAIKKISVQRGYDVSGYCLTVFGGAGAQHACAIADTLGMEACLIHPMASLLSAYGMGLADIRATRTQALEVALDEAGRMAAAALLDALGSDAEMAVVAQGVAPRDVRVAAVVHLKVKGTDTALPVDFGTVAAMRAAFQAAHRARFGFDPGEAALVVEAAEAEAVGAAADLSEAKRPVEERAGGGDRRGAGGAGLDRRGLGRRPVRAAGGAAAGGSAERAGGGGRAAYLDPGGAGVAGADHRARPCAAGAGRSRGRGWRRSGRRPIR